MERDAGAGAALLGLWWPWRCSPVSNMTEAPTNWPWGCQGEGFRVWGLIDPCVGWALWLLVTERSTPWSAVPALDQSTQGTSFLLLSPASAHGSCPLPSVLRMGTGPRASEQRSSSHAREPWAAQADEGLAPPSSPGSAEGACGGTTARSEGRHPRGPVQPGTCPHIQVRAAHKNRPPPRAPTSEHVGLCRAPPSSPASRGLCPPLLQQGHSQGSSLEARAPVHLVPALGRRAA